MAPNVGLGFSIKFVVLLNIAIYLELLTIFFHLIENGARRKAEIKNYNLYEWNSKISASNSFRFKAQKNNGFYYFKTQKSKLGNERKTKKLIWFINITFLFFSNHNFTQLSMIYKFFFLSNNGAQHKVEN